MCVSAGGRREIRPSELRLGGVFPEYLSGLAWLGSRVDINSFRSNVRWLSYVHVFTVLIHKSSLVASRFGESILFGCRSACLVQLS